METAVDLFSQMNPEFYAWIRLWITEEFSTLPQSILNKLRGEDGGISGSSCSHMATSMDDKVLCVDGRLCSWAMISEPQFSADFQNILIILCTVDDEIYSFTLRDIILKLLYSFASAHLYFRETLPL